MSGLIELPKKILLFLINFYRKYLSALKMQPTCRFYPTCSQYAYEAVSKYGFLKGGWMGDQERHLTETSGFHTHIYK